MIALKFRLDVLISFPRESLLIFDDEQSFMFPPCRQEPYAKKNRYLKRTRFVQINEDSVCLGLGIPSYDHSPRE